MTKRQTIYRPSPLPVVVNSITVNQTAESKKKKRVYPSSLGCLKYLNI